MNASAQVDDSTANRVREEADIVAIIGRYTHLHVKGPVHIGHCPLCHDEHNKFVINPERKRWRCFACGKHGDVFDFMMEKEFLNFEQAVKAVTTQLFNSITFDSIPDIEALPPKEKKPVVQHIQEALCDDVAKHEPNDTEKLIIKQAELLFEQLQTINGYRAAAVLSDSWEVLASDSQTKHDPPLFAAFCHRIEPLLEKLSQNCHKYVVDDNQQLTIGADNGTLLSFTSHFHDQSVHVLCLVDTEANLVLAKLYLLKIWENANT